MNRCFPGKESGEKGYRQPEQHVTREGDRRVLELQELCNASSRGEGRGNGMRRVIMEDLVPWAKKFGLHLINNGETFF